MLKFSNITTHVLRSGNVMLSYDRINEDEDLVMVGTSVSAPSAIAAYSRVEMTHFLTKYHNNIYAVDTVGIKVDCRLSPSEVDNKKIG